MARPKVRRLPRSSIAESLSSHAARGIAARSRRVDAGARPARLGDRSSGSELRRALSWAALALCSQLALLACDDAVVSGAGSAGPTTDAAADAPADFGALPEFRLLSERGQEVTLAGLRGRPLVFAALFSTCTGPCPSIARGLQELQRELAGTDVLLVAVSVNPEFDSPAVLANYAARVGADPERWIFLTGAESEVHAFVREGLLLAVARAGGEPGGGQAVTHDTRLLAVDRAGRRRGWYTGTDGVQLEKLRRRMLFLAEER